MAKFSILRDDDEDDEELIIRSPKRRRISQAPSPSIPNTDDDQHDHHQPPSTDANDDVTESTEEPAKFGSISVILSDPDVLDCSICFNPLTVPVFQCENGHIACSSCCAKLENKCPSCCGKIGYNRCRAIEKVVESIKVSCCYSRYGCRETIRYCEKHEHEAICTYVPCSCPFPDCTFRGSSMRLSLHMTQKHADFVVRFRFDSSFTVSVGLDDKLLVLQEEREGSLFILSHGSMVTVRCIDPRVSNRRFSYALVLHKGGNFLRFQSFTHCTTGQQVDSPPLDYFLVPGYFYNTAGWLKLEICIWNKSLSYEDIAQTANDIQNNEY